MGDCWDKVTHPYHNLLLYLCFLGKLLNKVGFFHEKKDLEKKNLNPLFLGFYSIMLCFYARVVHKEVSKIILDALNVDALETISSCMKTL